ncbi:hypothetical protein C2G38_1087843 [Gigaspora rosea]|uniref:Uncharacterized protein n=1 Tax=Gigaspora rosea TaxID=44941 RepID=A0A397VGF2_9GLOM|nr:hypothetical protein C2G38_1087843 [Gigaspora rosea]
MEKLQFYYYTYCVKQKCKLNKIDFHLEDEKYKKYNRISYPNIHNNRLFHYTAN